MCISLLQFAIGSIRFYVIICFVIIIYIKECTIKRTYFNVSPFCNANSYSSIPKSIVDISSLFSFIFNNSSIVTHLASETSPSVNLISFMGISVLNNHKSLKLHTLLSFLQVPLCASQDEPFGMLLFY